MAAFSLPTVSTINLDNLVAKGDDMSIVEATIWL